MQLVERDLLGGSQHGAVIRVDGQAGKSLYDYLLARTVGARPMWSG